jgi:hypothetical protein
MPPPVRLSEVDAVQCPVSRELGQFRSSDRRPRRGMCSKGWALDESESERTRARSCACARRYAGKSEAARWIVRLGRLHRCSTYFEAVPFPSPPVCFRQN